MINNHYRWLICSLAITIGLSGLWIGYSDHEKIFSAVSRIGWQGFLFLCLCSSFNYALRNLRWNFLLRRLGDRVGSWESLICYLSGFALTTTPGKTGEVIRCLYFNRRHQVSYSHSMASLFAERTMDAIVALLIGTLALYTFEYVRWIGIVFTGCIFVVVTLIIHQKMLLRLADLCRSIKLGLVQKILDVVPELLARTMNLFQPGSFMIGMAIGFLAWAAEGVAYAWLIHELGGQGSTLLYMSIFSIAVVVGALTFVPGGLGGTEVVLYVLTVATGVGDVEALTATLIIRLATLWYAVFLGILSVLWLESNQP